MYHSTPNFEDTILIIEDDPSVNRLFSKHMASLGVRVDSLFSVAEAYVYLHTASPPSIVILDLGLSDGSGTDILELLQAPRFEYTRVVVVSGHTYSPSANLNLKQVSHALLKPVSPRGLKALVKSLLMESAEVA